MGNILYLSAYTKAPEKAADIKYHNAHFVEKIEIQYKESAYMIGAEIGGYTKYNYRTVSKRGGGQLKKPIKELVNANALYLRSYYSKEVETYNGHKFTECRGLSKLDAEADKMNYCRRDLLKFINKYAVKKFSGVVIIEEKAAEIINAYGGAREKEILKNDCVFNIEKWEPDKKIIRCSARQNFKLTNYCLIDILNNSIL